MGSPRALPFHLQLVPRLWSSGRQDGGNENGFGPTTKINTLKSSASTAHNAGQTNDVRPAKRPRRDSTQSQTPIRSRHFGSVRRSPHGDMINGGSQEDLYDIRSLSSAGNPTTALAATVPEFRNAQLKGNSSSGRVRRSRQTRPLFHKSGSPSEPRDHPDSPDILTMDDEPPAANIVSEIPGPQRNPKRFRARNPSEPPLKRAKPTNITSEDIEDSADELAEPASARGGKKFSTASSHLDFSHRRSDPQAASKGDIPRTAFQSSNSSQPTHAFMLKEAVAGKYVWQAQLDQQAALVSHGSRGVQFIVDGNRFAQEVLDIEWAMVQKVFHAATHSQFVRIQRIGPNKNPPFLLLEFSSLKDATNFIAHLPERFDIIEKTREDMGKWFLQAKKNAIEYQNKNGSINDTMHIESKRPDIRSLRSHSPQKNNIEQTKGGSHQARREKLSDKLARSVAMSGSVLQSQDLIETNEPMQNAGRSLRSNAATTRSAGRASSKIEIETFDRWSEMNPGWRDRWKQSLVYPATGKNRATVDGDDISRLDEGEFLNDNLISFYLRYLQGKLERERPEILDKVYIFSSFFFEKLKSRTKYDGVKGWTAKIDLFSYDYIVVPVNENLHWYLAIICNPGQTLPNAQGANENSNHLDATVVTSSPKTRTMSQHIQAISVDDDTSSPATVRISDDLQISSPRRSAAGSSKLRRSTGGVTPNIKDPKIITLDSLGSPHSPTCRMLKDYLENEAKDKKGTELAWSPSGMTGKGVPQQTNFCDCGVFVLGYMEEFLKAPDEVARRLLQKEELEWHINPQRLRNDIRALLLDLQSEQQERLAKEKAAKKAAKLKSKAGSESNATDAVNFGAVSSPAPPLPGTASAVPASGKPTRTPEHNGATTPQQPTPETSKEQENPENASVSESKSPPVALPAARETSPKLEQMPPRPPIGRQTSPKPQRFIERLKDDSSEFSGDAYYSAPSSPGSKLAPRDGLPSLAAEVQPSEHFVQQIPSSESDGESKMKRVTKTLQPEILHSIEVSEDEKDIVNINDRNHEHLKAMSEMSPYFGQLSSNRTEIPRYEGIERSIED